MKPSLVALAFLCSQALGKAPDNNVLASCLMARAAVPSVTVHEVNGRNIHVMENYANGFDATYFKVHGKDFGYAKGSGGFGLIYSGRIYEASTAIDLGNYPTTPPDLNPVLGEWMQVEGLSTQYLCVSFPLGALGNSGSFQRYRGTYILAITKTGTVSGFFRIQGDPNVVLRLGSPGP